MKHGSGFPSGICGVSDGNCGGMERCSGYFCAPLQWVSIFAFANCVFREAALASLLKGEIVKQIFAFSTMVGLGVSAKSQIKHSLAIFLNCFSLHLNCAHST